MSLINLTNKPTFAISSNQVIYDGKITPFFKQKINCSFKEDDILFIIMDEIDKLRNNNLSLTSKIKEIEEKINNLNNYIIKLENKINSLNASNINITIDLDCLESNANNCCTGNIKTYPISTILNLFKKEICLLKN